MVMDANEEIRGSDCFVRTYGTTKHGHSVVCDIKNFPPYFYVGLPEHRKHVGDTELKLLVQCFNGFLAKEGIRNGDVISIEVVHKTTLDGFQGPIDPSTMRNPRDPER